MSCANTRRVLARGGRGARRAAAGLLWGLLALLEGWVPGPARADTPLPPEHFDVVVVDPGHGGEDQGATGPGGLLEKDLVLDVAQRLARRLRREGLRVVMTRSSDRFVSLEQRTAIANQAHADLFLSIHANASRYRRVRGTETFFASLEATDEAARDLAAAENLAFGDKRALAARGDPLLAILGDLIVTEYLNDSQEFARMVQVRLANARGGRSRGVKQAPFVVLMGVRMPAVLVEIGFLTNAGEERALRHNEQRERLAGGLADAVKAFRVRYEARLGPQPAAPGGD